jgi:hypothetical protein
MHLIVTLVLTALAFGGRPVPVLAQQMPDPTAHIAAMDKLEFMVGRWTGEAWMQRGEERVQTRMTEIVERKLGGVVLLIEGRGELASADSATGRVVHHAMGVVSVDPAAGTYALRSYIATGQYGDFTLTLMPDGVMWSREVPGGRIRNTARISGNEWHEVGEFSRDGTTWTQIMEMRLHRAPSR